MSRMFLLIIVSLLVALAGCGETRTDVAPPAVTVAFQDRPVLDLMEFLAAQYQRGLTVDQSLMTELNRPVSVSFDHATWEQVRDQVAESCQLDLSLGDDFLFAAHSSAGVRTGRLVMRFYGTESLTEPDSAYEALPLDLANAPADPQGLPNLAPMEADVAPEINEVIELIQSRVRPETWSHEGVAIEDYFGSMVITQTPETHARIRTFLAEQEALVQRQCVCRLYRLLQVPPGTSPVLNAAEWSALTSAKAVHLPPPAAVFIARNDERQRHFAGIQRLLVLDSDQNQNQHAPIMRIVSTGLSLSFRPTIMVDCVRMVTRLWATTNATFPTQVLADGAGQPLMTITTPQVATDAADDLREVPFGGAAIYRFGERTYALTVEVVDLSALKR